MPLHKYQVILHHTAGLAEDDFVNVLYFDTNEPDDIMADIHAAYAGLNAAGQLRFSSVVDGMTIKAYEGVTGEPDFQQDFAFVGSGVVNPSEVALCLSYGADDIGDDTTARRRGRIYLGPLGGNLAEVPTAAMIDEVLDFGEVLASIGLATGTTWHMYSPSSASSFKIEHISCDDAWDTQRRRGKSPSARTRRDVQ